MNGMAAVFFCVSIPTALEEERLKTEFIARKLEIPVDQLDTHTLTSQTTPTVDVNATTTTTPTTTTTRTTETGTGTNVGERDTLSLQTLKSSTDAGDKDEISLSPVLYRNTPYGTFPKRRKSQPEIALLISFDKPDVEPAYSLNGLTMNMDEITTTPTLNVLAPADIETDSAKPKPMEGLRVMINSAKRKIPKRSDIELDLPIDTAMEVVLREILNKFQIENAVWTTNTAGTIFQITFTVEFNEVYENLYDKLHEWGIGDREGSTISVMNCIASKSYTSKEDSNTPSDNGKENASAQKQGAWDRFMNSVRARLNVAQIVRDVRQDAAITFDFVILLISAAILASFGLIEDSTIFLASSMLISPLMGPIIAAIFGTVIKEPSLRSIGMRNELIGILVAIMVGFLFGLVVGTTDQRYGIGEGLTEEMLSRCDIHSLVVGVFTAIPSGAAAAIGILGGNIGSLVGVAISASLLPPAVNSGLLWALACIYKFFENDDSRYLYVVKSQKYSENQATELAILGTISMCLTLSNVICVYIMGILVLKVKEIAPIIGRNNINFWKHDIKIVRDLTKNGLESSDNAIIHEFANLAKEDQQALAINYDFLRKLDEVSYQNTWSPRSNRYTLDVQGEEHDNYSTVHKLEKIYTTVASPTDKRRRFSLSRRPTAERNSDNTNRYRILIDNNRPRVGAVPANATLPSKELPEIVVDLCPPIEHVETTTKRFTVTPAPEDPLLKRRSYNN